MHRNLLRGLVAAPALALALLAVPAGAAAQDKTESVAKVPIDCTQSYSDKDTSGWGNTFEGSINIRSGPSTSCTIVGVAYPGHTADYHCYKFGESGYTWTYLRDDDTGVTGWVRNDLLSDSGSYVIC
ncbi:SH3 domain-containing protein [Actinopolyspora xinjiangensis]|uniref:SH3 domain-containing protein n=2 Tax=Actinopolyspora xinjiangensis TaxID=405564 RepID=A0A1H0P2M7_9ACTN|nr:SH3 domain-containing protein [Actinopolyspora xinjiangensis]